MKKWLLNSAKVIGLSHIEDKIPCQVSVITVCKNNVYTAVLSDGCGSAHFSHYGSKIVVEKVSEFLCDKFDEVYAQSEDSIRKTITNLVLDNVNKFAEKAKAQADTAIGKVDQLQHNANQVIDKGKQWVNAGQQIGGLVKQQVPKLVASVRPLVP